MSTNSDITIVCQYEDCGARKKSLGTHLKLKHGISVQEYKTWCKARDKEADIGYTWKDRRSNEDLKTDKTLTSIKGSGDMIDGLSESEKRFFADRYKTLWENSGEDPVLSATLSQVVMNEIFIRRYQQQAQTMFGRSGISSTDVGNLHKTIDILQGQTLATLKSLNLTKEKRDMLNKSPESTPSRMVTSLALVCANMTPTEAAKNEKDIAEAMNRLREHTDDLLHANMSEDPNIPLETVEIG